MTPPFSALSLPPDFNVARHYVEARGLGGGSGRPAFIHEGRTLTFAEFLGMTRRMAGLLAGLGVEAENRVAFLLPNVPELAAGFWGAIWAGAVAVPVNTGYSPDDIRHVIAESRAKALVTTSEWRARLERIDSRFLREIVTVDGPDPLARLLESAVPMEAAADTRRDEPAFILYTSGTTGRPKGAVHGHADLVVSAELFAKPAVGIREGDVSYSVARIPFAYGVCSILTFPMAVGAASVLAEAANAFDVAEDLRRYRPTVFWGTPMIYSGLLAARGLREIDFSSIRACQSAADKLPESLWHAWKAALGLEIHEGLGSTELLGCFVANQAGHCRPGSSGRPLPGYRVEVVDGEGRPVPRGEIGNLQAGGGSLMHGYVDRLEETRAVLWGGSMRTSDKYRMDEDGYLYFMGRADDLFKIAGQWVSPLEIEAVLAAHPRVEACVALPEPAEGLALVKITAFVELKPGQADEPEKLAAELKSLARSRLPGSKTPQRYVFVERLPRNANGKVDRNALRGSLTPATAADGTPTPPGPR